MAQTYEDERKARENRLSEMRKYLEQQRSESDIEADQGLREQATRGMESASLSNLAQGLGSAANKFGMVGGKMAQSDPSMYQNWQKQGLEMTDDANAQLMKRQDIAARDKQQALERYLAEKRGLETFETEERRHQEDVAGRLRAAAKPEKTSYKLEDSVTAEDGSPLWTSNSGTGFSTATGQKYSGKVIPKDTSSSKPATDVQIQAAGFGKRAQAAHERVNAMMDPNSPNRYDPTTLRAQIGDSKPLEFLGLANYAKSSEDQVFDQAKRSFVSAVLRKESGAAISPQEYEMEERKYFPKPGDSPDVIQQKAVDRERAIALLQQQGGSAWEKVPSIASPAMSNKQPGTAIAAPASAPPAGKVKVVNKMNPADALFIDAADVADAQADGYEVAK